MPITAFSQPYPEMVSEISSGSSHRWPRRKGGAVWLRHGRDAGARAPVPAAGGAAGGADGCDAWRWTWGDQVDLEGIFEGFIGNIHGDFWGIYVDL